MKITNKLQNKLIGLSRQMTYRELAGDAAVGAGRFSDAEMEYTAACMLAMALADAYEGLGGFYPQEVEYDALQGKFARMAVAARDAAWEARKGAA